MARHTHTAVVAVLILALCMACGAEEAQDSGSGATSKPEQRAKASSPPPSSRTPSIQGALIPLRDASLFAGQTALAYWALTLSLKAATILLAWIVQPTRLGLVRPLLSILHQKVHPSTTAPTTVVDRLACHYEHIEHHAEHALAGVSKCLGLDLGHLGRCVAESAVVHLYLRPVLAPLKLAAAWSLVLKKGLTLKKK
mmetsp:Transcript_27704/g.54132  ORF Transcript_27704/g.54132 Transcript_27704/m.54132 type:complete len:197 (+) Transcript_27704:215-805(+)|eukprot:CAMPEP_0173382290 /NCGR_PEP_ID=MMETSP1356-20130122/4784_1 /TAXON_ID=77927 ORGANISM="Hemiselmis virescens, Strain PCC157" /NCGR_SAMPLE_ID=MMETSP1356 /ASSEMBLY_ACC=CAM_ASM_000847 /LENGTH=196 /DNA_ID=CAMNT_0014336545 /DNA_START=212 /DNA_END=802 /DNA_ORIENTATION=-